MQQNPQTDWNLCLGYISFILLDVGFLMFLFEIFISNLSGTSVLLMGAGGILLWYSINTFEQKKDL